MRKDLLNTGCVLLDVRVQRGGYLIRIIYALCLVGATVNHVRALLGRGWLPDDLPLATAIYWDSLTFVDPLAAALLFLRPPIGIALTVAIIVSDVTHNLWFTAAHSLSGSIFQELTSSASLMSQLAFLLFVAVTAPTAWKRSRPPGSRASSLPAKTVNKVLALKTDREDGDQQ